jgi:GNAT superfamily N-acetyltransferase
MLCVVTPDHVSPDRVPPGGVPPHRSPSDGVPPITVPPGLVTDRYKEAPDRGHSRLVTDRYKQTFRVERFRPELSDDFDLLHSDANGAGWCRCVAWWVETWEGWGERTAAENAALRGDLCRRGEYDGLLAYDGAVPVGWCQVGRRDRLGKLVRQLDLEPDPSTWAVTCFLVVPSHRGRGVARALLDGAVALAHESGARRIEGYPRNDGGEPDEQWTGPAQLYTAAGFTLRATRSPRAVVALDLRPTSRYS